ncbi:MAG: S8 family peptidase, partial [Pirellulaceae bacterium]
MSSIVRSFFVLAIASAIGLSASIAFAQPQVGIPENEKIGVIIGLKTEPEAAAAAQADAAQQISDLGGEVNHRYTIIPAVSAELPPQAIADLLNDPAIAFVELDGEVQALVETIPWGIDRIRALPNPNNGDAIEYTGGAGIVVAVLDSGVDLDHPDLVANMYINPGEIPGDGIDNDENGFIDDISGWDFNGDDNNADDDNGHGTHCAGTVAAVGQNDIGVVGAAPGALIMPIKVLSAGGGGSFSDIIAALDYVLMMKQNGVNVVVTSNSYGSGGNPGTAVEAAFDQAYAAGIIHLAAAGNSGNSGGTGESVGWPANYDSVVAVASTTINNTRSSFSSTGENVEIAAPGSSIQSTWPGGGYNTISGTSMACPHVAGAAAVLMAEASLLDITDANEANGIADEVRALLLATTIDLGPTGPDTLFGFGLL